MNLAPPKPIETTDISVHEVTHIVEEKLENSQIILSESHIKVLNEKQIDSDKLGLASHDVSALDFDNPMQKVSPLLLEKKFILNGSNYCHNKVSKANLTTRDSSISNENENLPNNRSKAIIHRKKSSISKKPGRIALDLSPLEEVDFDDGNVNEHPVHRNGISSPRNLKKYETRLFNNPHIQIYESISRKVITEYHSSDYSPERFGRSFTARFEEKKSFYSKLSLSTNLVEDQIDYKIPCLILKPRFLSNKVMIYFHGNGEDVNLARELLSHVRDHLNVSK